MLLAILILGILSVTKGAAPIDWIERSPNGAYELAYATGDEGGHYKHEAATADNSVSGKFGYRDPATGSILQTTYTAGRRGFRPSGPHIARKISLSQAGPTVPQSDGQYHPELDLSDPTESKAYDFSFVSQDVIKEEHADALGDVRGRYRYVDDRGVSKSVEYIAGANKGFNVLNAVPDSIVQAQNSPISFQGKRPVDKIRGLTAIQKSPDGSYRFAASGPDHKRSEVKDAFGNTRGSYSYIDDKGQLRVVEYIAGPKIGYQIINGRRPIPSALYPHIPDLALHPELFNLPELDSKPSPLNPFFPDLSPTLSPDTNPTTSSFFTDPFGSSKPPSSINGPSSTSFPGGPTTPSSGGGFPGGSSSGNKNPGDSSAGNGPSSGSSGSGYPGGSSSDASFPGSSSGSQGTSQGGSGFTSSSSGGSISGSAGQTGLGISAGSSGNSGSNSGNTASSGGTNAGASSSSSYPGNTGSTAFSGGSNSGGSSSNTLQSGNSQGSSTSSGFSGHSSSTTFPGGPTSTTSPSWSATASSIPWIDDDFAQLHHQLFPDPIKVPNNWASIAENGNKLSGSKGSSGGSGGGGHKESFLGVGAISAEEHHHLFTGGGDCCKGGWHSGPVFGRAVRAHIQSIDLTLGKHMSPGDALRLQP